MFPLQDHFDVAHLLGHPAFDHLRDACSAYRLVHEHNLADPTAHAWPSCLLYGTQLTALRRAELNACVHAVILFQAMMEKVPYFLPTVGSGINRTTASGFASSWYALLNQVSDRSAAAAARTAFDTYNKNCYSVMRNPIIHGRGRTDIDKVNSVCVAAVHAGMQAGWQAYDYLLAEAFGNEGQVHEPSWSTMCITHGVPAELDSTLYPDLGALSEAYMMRHLDGARAAADAS